MNRQPIHNLLFLAGLSILTLFCLYLAAANLANYNPITGDDGWIMSASYKLASEGIFGSDPYTGFFNTDQHYFINLPFYHFLQAAAFKLMGFGVFQARLPNLFSAVLLIWLTAALANRHYGRKAALLAATLLILLCPNPFSTEPCNMLLVYARNGRYDLPTTALVWAAVWLLDSHVRRPNSRAALALGLTAALAALTQFFGLFILLPIGLIFVTQFKIRPFRRHPAFPFAAGFLLLTGPYLVFVLKDLNDFIGQSTLKSDRLDLFRPGFYLENILREPDRFRPLTNFLPGQLTGILLLTISSAAITFILLKRMRHPAQKAPPIYWLSCLGFILCLALFEQTKAPVYTIILLPGICLALAAISARCFRYLYHWKRPFPLRFLAAALLILLAYLMVSGVESAARLLKNSRQTTPYLELGRQIDSAIPPDATILGPDRWWPALKDHPYLALNNLLAQWQAAVADGRSPTFSQLAAEANIQFVLINYNIYDRFDIEPDTLQTQFWDYLSTCATLHAQWQHPNYGRIELYQIQDSLQPCHPTPPANQQAHNPTNLTLPLHRQLYIRQKIRTIREIRS